ncbi:hypothetical protein [Streptomyces himalayensis]|uniref:hypothetical protein n=1 Tax=Streptomyces himalayensis TaxID=2820085 RepID=UPI00215DC375|nr:hypothetical protein [Streptomyces himalayensis]
MGDNSAKSDARPDAEEQAQAEERPQGGKSGAKAGRPDRAGVITAAVALAACGGLVLYGVLSPGGEQKKKREVPTASVTYEVTGTGTADITYQARNESGKATVEKAAALPWRKTVPVPLGRSPVVSIVLGEKGGQARCAVAVQGRHMQSATASGGFGRATCSGTLPSPSPNPADAAG